MTTVTNQHYDIAAAGRMVPLLEGIVAEIRERSRIIRTLRKELNRLCDAEGDLPIFDDERAEALECRSRLATQLRERRLALEEIEDLGCFLAETDRMIRIPGPSGGLEDGFLWHLSDGRLEPVLTPETAG